MTWTLKSSTPSQPSRSLVSYLYSRYIYIFLESHLKGRRFKFYTKFVLQQDFYLFFHFWHKNILIAFLFYIPPKFKFFGLKNFTLQCYKKHLFQSFSRSVEQTAKAQSSLAAVTYSYEGIMTTFMQVKLTSFFNTKSCKGFFESSGRILMTTFIFYQTFGSYWTMLVPTSEE